MERNLLIKYLPVQKLDDPERMYRASTRQERVDGKARRRKIMAVISLTEERGIMTFSMEPRESLW